MIVLRKSKILESKIFVLSCSFFSYLSSFPIQMLAMGVKMQKIEPDLIYIYIYIIMDKSFEGTSL